MKKMLNYGLISVFFAAVFVFAGCDDSSGSGPGGNETPSKIITFGSWPQTIKADKVKITDEKKDVGMFTYFKGSDGEWYVKTEERGYEAGYTYSNGTPVLQDGVDFKYFKVEPIKWRVLTENYNGKKLLLAENILINIPFFYDWVSGREEDGKEIFANNYKYSQVRAFLNGLTYQNGMTADNQISTEFYKMGFLQTAFTEKEQARIAVTIVDNSKRSTEPDDNINYPESWDVSEYVCDNTKDKVFLLSEQEVTTEAYGFDPDPDASVIDGVHKKSSRIRMTTDFAKACGAFQNPEKGMGGCWWLRTPTYAYAAILIMDFLARNISNAGAANSSFYTYDSASGVVPALCLE